MLGADGSWKRLSMDKDRSQQVGTVDENMSVWFPWKQCDIMRGPGSE